MAGTAEIHPDDVWHVCFDALELERERIAVDDTFRPWEDYTSEPHEDAKRTREGYLAVIEQAKKVVRHHLDGTPVDG